MRWSGYPQLESTMIGGMSVGGASYSSGASGFPGLCRTCVAGSRTCGGPARSKPVSSFWRSEGGQVANAGLPMPDGGLEHGEVFACCFDGCADLCGHLVDFSDYGCRQSDADHGIMSGARSSSLPALFSC